MAYYKHHQFFHVSNASDFDRTNSPGVTTPYSGMYYCDGCGREIVSEKNKPLPPQNHHQHTQAQGSIRWRLIAATQQP